MVRDLGPCPCIVMAHARERRPEKQWREDGDRRGRPDWLGAVVAIYEGEHRKHFYVLSYTHPVYMLQEQARAPHPRMHFYLCTPKDSPAPQAYPLVDTSELTADDYLFLCKRYQLRNISSCAGPNDETAVLCAAGLI